ncbi:MAG: hypothetical protein LBL91_06360 [Lachnospiraceae bacterium]|jgi:hypothetical protein|nr:hypothetical protein [Lachnospiraceae bacterium]
MAKIVQLKDYINGVWTNTFPKLNDSGWITLPLNSDTVVANQSFIPAYRKIGNVVYITGIANPKDSNNEFNKSPTTDKNLVTTLPIGFRPGKFVDKICQGSGASLFRIELYTTGQLYITRYGEGTNGNNFGANPPVNGNILNLAINYVSAD